MVVIVCANESTEWSDRQCLECSYASSQDHEVKMSVAQKEMQATWEANGEEEG